MTTTLLLRITVALILLGGVYGVFREHEEDGYWSIQGVIYGLVVGWIRLAAVVALTWLVVWGIAFVLTGETP